MSRGRPDVMGFATLPSTSKVPPNRPDRAGKKQLSVWVDEQTIPNLKLIAGIHGWSLAQTVEEAIKAMIEKHEKHINAVRNIDAT